MEKLSLILWRERELLESLLFKLESEQLILASGNTRWLGRAAEEVEALVEQIRETEVLRAIAADAAAEQAGLAAHSSLRSLAEACDDPWRTVFTDHYKAFQVLTHEVAGLAERNRNLITAGYRSAREAMLALESDGIDGYRQDGQAVTAGPRSSLVDRSL
ncbi:flagellar protein FlgN [Nocardioides daejeonensis]|uniref:flagellar protein FlgN n=1 Tax=Nocardioides daejeonensis TaxID=1046556 RepID=UPI000D74AFA4|nr:flagellar protein FlgN [Nocardioides daejeonensis]